jgi:hypothetical protein
MSLTVRDGTSGRAHLFVHRNRQRDDGSSGPAFWAYSVHDGVTDIWFGPLQPLMRWSRQTKDVRYWDGKVEEKLGKGYERVAEVSSEEAQKVLDIVKACLGGQALAFKPALAEPVRKFIEKAGLTSSQRRDWIRRMTEVGALRSTRSAVATGPVIAVSVDRGDATVNDDLDVQVF